MNKLIKNTLLVISTILLLISCNKYEIEDSIMDGSLKATGAYYVSPNGNDLNPGTLEQPWATWQRGFNSAAAGNIIYIRGGVYNGKVVVNSNSGTYENPLKIYAYNNEKPVLIVPSSSAGISLNYCNYIHLKGLTIQGGSMGVGMEHCNEVKLEQIVTRYNHGAGIWSYKNGITYLVNCDSYNNYDESGSGGQADGFVICYGSSTAFTEFRGCRSWYNSDDGYDTWENEGFVVFENCWAFNNGRDQGDGGGFKLGQTIQSPQQGYQKILKNCLAFHNRFIGFNQNGGNNNMLFYNCTSYHNDSYGFDVGEFNTEIIVKNCVNYSNSYNTVSSNIVHSNNSWDLGLSLTNSDFISVDSTGVTNVRQADGSLPIVNFMRPSSTGKLIDKGTNVGIPYSGAAPDLGCFEYGVIINPPTDTVIVVPPVIPPVVHNYNGNIVKVTFNRSRYIRGVHLITASITIENTGDTATTYYVNGYIYRRNGGLQNFSPTRKVIKVDKGKTGVAKVSWLPNSKVNTGYYTFYVNLYKDNTSTLTYDTFEKLNAFNIVKY